MERERTCFAAAAAWRRRAGACPAPAFAGNADAAGANASNKPRQSHRIGADARSIQIILFLLLA